jgi:ligand-binding SRPBCC domain-containing protein
MGLYQIYEKQWLPASSETLWDFVATPRNLARITPPRMGFEILTPDLPPVMHSGMIIAYRVRPLPGWSTTWVTRISEIIPGEYFVDEQILGPYRFWHHEHRLTPGDGGTWMEDRVSYIPPLGILGDLAQHLLIRGQLREIFEYRKKAMEALFPQK